jgi:hypothetical protein
MVLHDRRALLRASLIGAGTLLTKPMSAQTYSAPDADVPNATLNTLVFQSKRLDASAEEFRRWYVERHGPSYLSVAGPFLKRYARLFVDKAWDEPVDFDCITELGFRSRDALFGSLRALDAPEGRAALARNPRPGSVPGPNEARDGPRRFSVEERLLSGPPRRYDPPGTRLQAVLLRRVGDESQQEAFAKAVTHQSVISRMTLSLSVREPRRAPPHVDAVFLIWPAGNLDLQTAFDTPPPEVRLFNGLDLALYEPDLQAP